MNPKTVYLPAAQANVRNLEHALFMRRLNGIMIHIRPFTNTGEDFAALMAIHEALEPDQQLTVPILRRLSVAYWCGLWWE
jgi:hypothetical protein